MKERPRALGSRGPRPLATAALAEPRTKPRERARVSRPARRLLERRTLEEQPYREVSAQRDSEIARGNPVGTLLNLPDDAGPSTQGEELGREIRLVLTLTDAKFGEGVRDRVESVPAREPIVTNHAREGAGPRSCLRRHPGPEDLEKAAVYP